CPSALSLVTRGELRVIEFAGHSARKRHGPGRTVFIDVDIEATRQRIDDRRTDTVQTAGRVVRSAAELSAGMQFGEHHFHARQTGPRLGVDRDSAPVITNFSRTVIVQY